MKQLLVFFLQNWGQTASDAHVTSERFLDSYEESVLMAKFLPHYVEKVEIEKVQAENDRFIGQIENQALTLATLQNEKVEQIALYNELAQKYADLSGM